MGDYNEYYKNQIQQKFGYRPQIWTFLKSLATYVCSLKMDYDKRTKGYYNFRVTPNIVQQKKSSQLENLWKNLTLITNQQPDKDYLQQFANICIRERLEELIFINNNEIFNHMEKNGKMIYAVSVVLLYRIICDR
ncbi:uncharacterized protein LOC122501734 [Leptopilina heterotoma]|uniref:uncharacterized protein LOC122501734 n=1 Tax=Leptopilina heterotoma TaxID=63436 RepID=UPI001CA8C669|nr:uncharacterized protein LOC122501734 [Leptopilina heterotoma]